jgi:hypothetical protein
MPSRKANPVDDRRTGAVAWEFVIIGLNIIIASKRIGQFINVRPPGSAAQQYSHGIIAAAGIKF